MRLFLLTLLSLYKNIFFSVAVGRKKSSFCHGRDVDFPDGIVLLASESFDDMIMTYILQQLQFNVRVKQLCL